MKKLLAFFVLVVVSTSVHAQKYHYDVNGDGMVNVSDVTTFVNNILGVPNGGEDEKNYVYDVNGDGTANVTDVTCLVNKILGILNPGEDTKPCLTCPDDHHPHIIDLGLPSGTMWACCNVGADKPESYGGYYAWGETKEHEDLIFDWSTYTLCKGSDNTCVDLGSHIAGTQYDVAHVEWGDTWVMPSTAQIEELIYNCTYEWTKVNGLKGGKLTSKTNGGSIFLPATGYRWYDKLYDAGSIGGYWTSTPGDLSHAYRIYVGSIGASWGPGQYRNNGLTVRPVSCPRLQLSTDSLRLAHGAVGTVDITSGSGSYTLESSAPGVATATLEGSQVTVTATGLGNAVITVTDLWTRQRATVEVNVSTCPDDHHPHMIDLGLPSGTKWACCNVDTEAPGNQSPSNHGSYYSWGETEVKDTYNWYTYAYRHGDDYEDLGTVIAGTKYDVAQVKWGDSWVMPTYMQMKELEDNCTYTWTTMNGVKGGLVTGPNGSTIFLPAAGYRWNDIFYNVGSIGYYWSATLSPSYSTRATNLFFSRHGTDWYGFDRNYGYTVRPVSCPRLQLSTTSLRLALDAVGTVEITSGSGCYTVEGRPSDVVTTKFTGGWAVNNQLTVYGQKLGQAYIIVTDLLTGQTAKVEVIVSTCPDDHHPHKIDLGLPSGTKWACCNVDTEHPENQSPTNLGGHYSWGETKVKKEYWDDNYDYDRFSDSDIAGTKYDVAHVKWGGSWVMPSSNQLEELMKKCNCKWTSVNGVKGEQFRGPNGGVIFLPAAGYGWGDIQDVGKEGHYWSSKPTRLMGSGVLFFKSGKMSMDSDRRSYGNSVRPVSK